MKVNKIISFVFAAAMLCACANNLTPVEPVSQTASVGINGEKVVDLNVAFSSWEGIETRSQLPVQPEQKTAFKHGDLIHIEAEFLLNTGVKVKKYDAFFYVESKDKDLDENGKSIGRYPGWYPNKIASKTASQIIYDTPLTWPVNAVTATFKAYYINDSNMAFTDGGSKVGRLSESHIYSDPLFAEAKDVPSEHVAVLKMNHLTTRLVVLNTSADYAETYWFNKSGMSNSYRLSYTEADGLKFEFYTDADYCAGTVPTVKDTETGYVTIYLEPGKYAYSSLNHVDNRLYLSFNVEALDDPHNLGDASTGLLAGQTYSLDIKTVSGVIDREEVKDPWDPDDPVIDDFDIQKFLNAISNNQSYATSTQQILVHNPETGKLELVVHLDFPTNQSYTAVTVPSNVVFDGQYHFLKGVRNALFSNQEGKISNLELRDANISQYETKYDEVSALSLKCTGGVLENIRFTNIAINVKAKDADNSVLSAGVVAGKLISASVSDICFRGNLSVTVSNPDGAEAAGEVYQGLVAGQVTGGGIPINNVSLASYNGSEPQITITNNCTSGIYSVGGLMGLAGGGAKNCTLNLTVDCSSASGTNIAVGGLFGKEITGENLPLEFANCLVSGAVKGAKVKSVTIGPSTKYGRSYLGGLGGNTSATADSGTLIHDCKSFCAIEPYAATSINNEIYFTGSAFGAHLYSVMIAKDCGSYGNIAYSVTPYTEPNENGGGYFVGSFVGASTSGDDYPDTDHNGNIATNNSALNFIGYIGNI
ncbi:MAG: hypothetical protein HUJ95_04080 [Bacteroidales bacterium]|nr:hypothetical protein [Bacteroidales bacterium]